MSLEELREQAEQVTEEAEVVEVVEDIQEEEPKAEEETTPVEPSNDFELELEGAEDTQTKPTSEEAIVYKLTKERKKRKKADSERAELEKKVAELESRLAVPVAPVVNTAPVQPVTTYTQMPDIYDKGIDGDRAKYDLAVKQFLNNVKQSEQELATQQAQQKAAQDALTEKSTRLATRASKFIQENNINQDRVIDAIETATDEIDGVTGIDGALAHLLDSVGEGSEKVAYYIGTNKAAMESVKRLLQEDPNGFKAIAHMTRLTEKLKRKTNNISAAPAPDEAVKGDGSAKSAEAIQKLYDKSSDPQELLRLREKARSMGVTLT